MLGQRECLNLISEDDTVLLVVYGKKGKPKKFLVKVKKGKVLHTHKGSIDLSEIIGKEWGCVIKTSKGERVEVHRPILTDYIEKIGRITQIIYPKDAGFMILKSGIKPGDTVVEIGTGSGALTMVLANFLGPSGKLYSYDIRKESLEIAEKNLKLLGISNVILKHKDAKEGIDESDVDAIFLDIPDPWEILSEVHEKLRPNGTFLAFLPSCEQVNKTVLRAREVGFGLIEIHEILDREYESDERRTRPSPWMIGHTGFIVIGRKLSKES
ncbi:MAG: tRNA (adenine-N1)-methyltransferase [Candidatus Korarchaeum sp.]|jgi:tRNA (adenine57-N1/adenine58-N1)-methyltransferase|nr:tRNA (adenine-N1)-methyltransferase [Candidatus Korarchaeum sp.]